MNVNYVWLCLLFFISTECSSDTKIGKVVRVVDGDTLVFLDSHNVQHKVRLAGIDTPEKKQPFGAKATKNLISMTGNKAARLEWSKVDRWNRIIGKIYVKLPDDHCINDCLLVWDVNLAQVKDGFAWHYKKYANEQSIDDQKIYASAENDARERGAGLWADPYSIPPWEWRRR